MASLILGATPSGTAHASNPTHPVSDFQRVAERGGYLGHVKSPTGIIQLPPGTVLNPKLLGLHHGWHHLPPLNRISPTGDRAVEDLLVQLLNPKMYAQLSRGEIELSSDMQMPLESDTHPCKLTYGILRSGRNLEHSEELEIPVSHEMSAAATCKAEVRRHEDGLQLTVHDIFEFVERRTPTQPEGDLPNVLRENDSWREQRVWREQNLILTIDGPGNLELTGYTRNKPDRDHEVVHDEDDHLHLRVEELGWAIDDYLEQHGQAPAPHEVHEVVLAACHGDPELAGQVIAREAQMREVRSQLDDLDSETSCACFSTATIDSVQRPEFTDAHSYNPRPPNRS